MNDFEATLRDSLKTAEAGYAPSDAAGALERFLARRRRRRIVRVAGAALAAGAAVVAVVTFLQPDAVVERRRPVQSVPTASPGRSVVTGTFDLGPDLSDVEVFDDTVYVAHSNGAEVLFVDPETGEWFGRISHRMGDVPSSMAIADGALFGINNISGTLDKYELPSGRPAEPVDRVPLGAEATGVVVGGGSVWVASSAPEGPADRYVVRRFDAETLEELATVEVPAIANLDYGFGSLWAGTSQGLFRLDPSTDESSRIGDVGSVSDVSVGAGGVWVYQSPARGLEAEVLRIDPQGSVAQRTSVRGFFGEVTADDVDGIWVLNSTSEFEKQVIRIDPASGSVLGAAIDLEGSIMEIASGAGAAWVVEDSQGMLTRVEVRSSG
ncbi:MAG: hypothetical protein ABR529_08420 [Actinomycetota bacterium]